MRFGLTIVLGILLFLIGLPMVSGLLGLASHRDYLPPPGSAIDIEPGRSLNVHELGQGDPVIILVHGLPGSGQMMMPLARALADDFRVLAYDRLGWVHSDKRPADELADPSNNARDLLNLVEALGVRRPILVGYSYGGGVVQELNRLAPDLPRCNVLIASVGNGRPREDEQGLVSSLVFSEPVMAWSFAFTPIATRSSGASMRALFHPEDIDPDRHLEIVATLERSVDAWLREGRERFAQFDAFSPELVTRQTLIVHGEQDLIIAATVGEQLHRDITTSRLHREADAGHAIVLTHAAELAQLISHFVQSCE